MRDTTNPSYHFGRLKMWNDTIRKSTQVGVVIESEANKKLFGKFFQTNCLFIACNGKAVVQYVIEEANKQELEGVLAIVDADFCRIENSIPNVENLFLTDQHDTEIMLINSPAWDNVLYQYADTSINPDGSGNKLGLFEESKKESIKTILLELAGQVANIRLLNERENLALKFKTRKKKGFDYINYSRFIDENSLELNLDVLKQTVEQKSNQQGLFQNEPLNETLKTIQKETHDLLELCNGHDVLHILSLALERAISNKNSSRKITGEQLEKDLIIAYRYDDFMQTELFINLQHWQTKNPPFLLLKAQAN